MKYPNNLMYLWLRAPIHTGYFLTPNPKKIGFKQTKTENQYLQKLNIIVFSLQRYAKFFLFPIISLFTTYMFALDIQIFGLQSLPLLACFTLTALLTAKYRIAQNLTAGKKGIGIGPIENSSTFFILIIGLLASIFALVGNFGAQGFIPFALFVAGFIISGAAQRFFKKQLPPAVQTSGVNVKTLTWIAGGVILVLAINYSLNYAFHLSFLLPPLSADALAASSKFGYFPVYMYTTLYALSEEYMFRSVILYIAYQGLPGRGSIFQEIGAVMLSSFGWVIFHLWVYGSAPLVLAFVFFTGIVFGFITLYSKNILAASTIHGINNIVAAGLTIIAVTG